MPYLYREFKRFGENPITGRATKLDKSTGKQVPATYHFPDEVLDLLQKTIAAYSGLSPFQLVEITHAPNGPWDQIWHHENKINAGMRIPNELITNFYSAKSRPMSS